MAVSSCVSSDQGTAVVTEMTKDLRLAAELGTSLLNANEDLRQQLSDALERERSLSELVTDLRRKLATSDEEILTLSAELAELQQSKSGTVDDGRSTRMERSLQQVLSTIHADQQNLKLERKAIVDQAEAIRVRENDRCRDIEAIRAHCLELEARVDTMTMANALVVLKSYARLRKLEHELEDSKMMLLHAQTQLKRLDLVNRSANERFDAKKSLQHSKQSNHFNLGVCAKFNNEEIDDERNGNNVLLDFFFLTAMACKIDLVGRGLSKAALTITNEELYESLVREADPVPFYQYNNWIRLRLADKLAPELEDISNLKNKVTDENSLE